MWSKRVRTFWVSGADELAKEHFAGGTLPKNSVIKPPSIGLIGALISSSRAQVTLFKAHKAVIKEGKPTPLALDYTQCM